MANETGWAPRFPSLVLPPQLIQRAGSVLRFPVAAPATVIWGFNKLYPDRIPVPPPAKGTTLALPVQQLTPTPARVSDFQVFRDFIPPPYRFPVRGTINTWPAQQLTATPARLSGFQVFPDLVRPPYRYPFIGTTLALPVQQLTATPARLADFQTHPDKAPTVRPARSDGLSLPALPLSPPPPPSVSGAIVVYPDRIARPAAARSEGLSMAPASPPAALAARTVFPERLPSPPPTAKTDALTLPGTLIPQAVGWVGFITAPASLAGPPRAGFGSTALIIGPTAADLPAVTVYPSSTARPVVPLPTATTLIPMVPTVPTLPTVIYPNTIPAPGRGAQPAMVFIFPSGAAPPSGGICGGFDVFPIIAGCFSVFPAIAGTLEVFPWIAGMFGAVGCNELGEVIFDLPSWMTEGDPEFWLTEEGDGFWEVE